MHCAWAGQRQVKAGARAGGWVEAHARAACTSCCARSGEAFRSLYCMSKGNCERSESGAFAWFTILKTYAWLHLRWLVSAGYVVTMVAWPVGL